MIKFIKNNKILSSIILLNIIIFIISITVSIKLDNNIKEQINNNIIKLLNEYKNNEISTFKNYIKNILQNTSLITIIWLLGISVIGIPIIIGIYSIKTFISVFEILFLIRNINQISLIFFIIYSIISIINILLFFILLYYSITYSYILIRYLINKSNYNLKKITKKYLKIYVLLIFIINLSSILEIFILPKIYLFFN